MFAPISDLARDDGLISLIEQRLSVIARDQQRHQVFKHRRRPRDERASGSVNLRQLPAQPEPVFLRRVAFRNRHEAGEARFRSQQIIKRIIAAALRHVVTDDEQLAFAIQQKLKVHRLD